MINLLVEQWIVTGQEPYLEWVCFKPSCIMWALDFVQERFHNTSPSDFESIVPLLKLGTVKQGRAQDIRNNRGEPRQACFDFLEMLQERNEPRQSYFDSLRSQRKGGLGGRFRGFAGDELPLPIAPLDASLQSLGNARLKWKKGVGMLPEERTCVPLFLLFSALI